MIQYFNESKQAGLVNTRRDQEKAPPLLLSGSFMFWPDYPIRRFCGELHKEYMEVLWRQYDKYAEKYSILEKYQEPRIYSSKIQQIDPGEGFHVWHSEVGSRDECNRILVYTVYLNDDFEAGETEFIYQQYRYKPKQGDVVIFPAAFTHTHRGNPPIGNSKYIITGWVEY